MKAKLIIGIVVTFIIFCLWFAQEREITVDTEESFYSSFNVDGNKVYIHCNILIKNPNQNEVNVALAGTFNDDAENGLLKNPILDGYSSNCQTKTFILQRGDNWLDVVFIGEYAGKNQKCDRLLPEIQIIEVQ